MTINVPYKIRAALYVLTALGTPLIGYLFDQGHIGTGEVALWGAEVAVVNVMAALNTPNGGKE